MALDVGTSSARARGFDAAGRALPGADGRASYEPVLTPDGGVEFDADALVDAAARAVDGCLATAPAEPAAAVGVSAFWHSLLALDGAGRPLTPVITWADTRSAPAAAALRRRLDPSRIHARTGAPLHAAFFPAKLTWLRDTRPTVFAGARTWCGFPDYLAARLTGRLATSISMASGTGLLDQETLLWDRELLEVCHLRPAALPPIDDTPAPGLAAPFAARWPRLAAARWHPGAGDGACASVGSHCVTPDRIALNVGTSAALRLVLSAVPFTPKGLWRYRLDAFRSVVGGATSEGGNTLAWCRRVLAVPRDDAELERALAAVPPDGHGLTALPFLAGERSPGWHGEARALVSGLALDTDAVAIARAMLESVAHRLAIVYERLAPLAAPGHRVIASGGALHHSPTWAGIVADALGVPIVLAAEPEASSRGAALLALSAIAPASPDPMPEGATVMPDPARHEVYRAALERQRHLYETVVGPEVS